MKKEELKKMLEDGTDVLLLEDGDALLLEATVGVPTPVTDGDLIGIAIILQGDS